MNSILKDERLDFVRPCNMAFLYAFDAEMERLGYFSGDAGPRVLLGPVYAHIHQEGRQK